MSKHLYFYSVLLSKRSLEQDDTFKIFKTFLKLKRTWFSRIEKYESIFNFAVKPNCHMALQNLPTGYSAFIKPSGFLSALCVWLASCLKQSFYKRSDELPSTLSKVRRKKPTFIALLFVVCNNERSWMNIAYPVAK